MRRFTSLCLALTLALTLVVIEAGISPAQADSGANWTGEYFNNRNLTAPATFVRIDNQIDFNWQADSPVPGIIPADGFSVRWSAPQQFAAGTYRFTVTVDDGVRLFVDDQPVIDAWRDQTLVTLTGEVTLTEGSHWVRVEYYDAVDQAIISVTWVLLGAETAPGGWAAEYYNNVNLEGPQVGGRLEQTIDYNWGGGSPIPGIVNTDGFSARWWGFPELTAGTYSFIAWADDGVRVWVDSTLVVDAWTPAIYQQHRGTITLDAGAHTIRVEYFEIGDQARINVYWVREGAAAPVEQPLLPAPPPSTVTATIATRLLNVRSGPGVTWPVLTRVREFEVYTVIGRNADSSWWQISGPGFTGWVSGSFIRFNSDNSSVPLAEGQGGTTTISPTGTLQARSNASLRIRRGPATNEARVGALNIGETATVIGRSADSAWLQIRTLSGLEGWVSAAYVALVGDVPLSNIPVTG